MVGYLGLGSDLGDRRAHLRAGLRGLERGGLVLLARSSVWETEPVDARGPSWFLNMAVAARGPQDPPDWLALLARVEEACGRLRAEPNGPRTLDLDLLLLEGATWNDARLVVPHPRMWGRRFVLAPLAEIAPDLRDPRGGPTVRQRLAELGDPHRVRRAGPLAGTGIIAPRCGPGTPGTMSRPEDRLTRRGRLRA